MNNSFRVHFFYIVGILLAIIVLTATLKLGAIEGLVGFITFGLALASLLLSLLAIVYAYISGNTLSQNLGMLSQASQAISDSSSNLLLSSSDLEARIAAIPPLIGEVGERVSATQKMIEGLQNLPLIEEQAAEPPKFDVSSIAAKIASRSSNYGMITMYSLARAYSSSAGFNYIELGENFIGRSGDRYFSGWSMALDAAQFVRIRTNKEIWTLRSFSEPLLSAILAAAVEVKDGQREASEQWNAEMIESIDQYFSS